MKLLEPVTLVSYFANDRDKRYPFDTKVIDPLSAIKWVASGRFSEAGVHSIIRPWSYCDNDAMLAEYSRDEARFEMAQELVEVAIRMGRVQCVYIRDDPSELRETGKKLVAISAEQFANTELSASWDDGFRIQLCEAGSDWQDEDKIIWLPQDAWFLWDEIAAMRPDYTTPEAVAALPAPAAVRPPQPETPRVRDRRGKPAKRWGKLMAGVLRKAAAHGLPDAFALPNKTIGGWLIDVHTEAGASPIPALEDAGRDARALLDALQEILSDRLASEAPPEGVAEKASRVAE